jgi:hypothetical protein
VGTTADGLDVAAVDRSGVEAAGELERGGM